MKSIPFYQVSNRNMSLQGCHEMSKISFKTVNNNLNYNNLLMFTESKFEDMTTHCNRCIRLYDKLLETTNLNEQDKTRINNSLFSNLQKAKDLESINSTISSTKNINKDLFFEFVDRLDNCDRVLRNEARLAKRFNLNKTIRENMIYGTKHTVFELCSLLDTYDIEPKAKFNIALENVSYAFFKAGYRTNLNEVTECITEYFLTRDAVITDKQYNGYIHILEHNNFINRNNDNLSYIYEAKNTKGNSYKDKANKLIDQCEDKNCKKHMKQILLVRNEKDASKYIDDSIDMIIKDALGKPDSLLVLKSIYTIPLLGHISSDFVNYKVHMSKNKVNIKSKIAATREEAELINKAMDDGSLVDFANFISEGLHFEDYILDESYTEPDQLEALIELGFGKNKDKKKKPESVDNTKKIIDSFKASNEKTPSKFKAMIYRIMTKSPENIIDETPNIFSAVRIMLYLGVAAAFPLGPVFAALLALVDKFVSMHLELKQAERMLKHFKSEKEKMKKKAEKASGKKKEDLEDYIKCLDKCIEKVKAFISKIDDENDEVNDMDDFDLGDDDLAFESAGIEVYDFSEGFYLESSIKSGTICNISSVDEIIDMIDESTSVEVLEELSVLFDNCPADITDRFYNAVQYSKNISLERNTNRFMNESSFTVEYEAMQALTEILNEAKKDNKKPDKDKKEEKTFKNPLNKIYMKKDKVKEEKPKDGKKDKFRLSSLKMTVVNFRQKVRDLKGKEQELWRNIDISMSQLTRGIEKALTSDRREAIIRGSIIPSFSKCIKFAISVGAIGAFTGPVGTAIAAVGMLGASKALNERERRLIYDEIDTELQVVEKQIQMAENEGNMNQYRFLLNYEKKLKREKQRIKYGIKMSGRSIPELKKKGD